MNRQHESNLARCITPIVRDSWKRQANSLVLSWISRPDQAGPEKDEILLHKTQDVFERARSHIQFLHNSVCEPRILASANRSNLETARFYWRLLGSVAVAIAVSLVLVANSVRTMRRQELLAQRAISESENLHCPRYNEVVASEDDL